MRALIAILLVAYEQASPSDPPTPPAPPPSPITPAPTPIPITPTVPSPTPELDVAIMLRLTPTELTANRDHLLHVTPSTTAVELDRAAFAALSAHPHDSSTRVIIEADKSLAYANVLALLEAAKRAGYTRIAFSVPPSP